jgi:eukaryotic-like serine/threonine-protein kinase
MSEETLFHAALAQASAERAAFLDTACAGQPQFRAAVEALLAAHEACRMMRVLRQEEPPKSSPRLSNAAALPSLAALQQTEPRKPKAVLRLERDWVVMQCLEKQRERRHATANGPARDSQRYLAEVAAQARPPSAAYRLRKSLKRHKGPVVAASLVLLALLAGFVGTTWGLFEAKRQQPEAERQEAPSHP